MKSKPQTDEGEMVKETQTDRVVEERRREAAEEEEEDPLLCICHQLIPYGHILPLMPLRYPSRPHQPWSSGNVEEDVCNGAG